MNKSFQDHTLENLLILDGEHFIIDEKIGVWVKFEVRETPVSVRKNGIRYSLTLHDKEGIRLLGFDNAHEIEYGGKNKVAPLRIFDHFHDEKGVVHPYFYQNAGELIKDFWLAVENRLLVLGEGA